MEAYCVKCRDRRKIENPQPVTLANGRNAVQGTCPTCGTKIMRIVKIIALLVGGFAAFALWQVLAA